MSTDQISFQFVCVNMQASTQMLFLASRRVYKELLSAECLQGKNYKNESHEIRSDYFIFLYEACTVYSYK